MKSGGKNINTSMVLALILWVPAGVRADVTIRYRSELKPVAALQPIMDPLMKAVQAGAATSILMKGNKAYTPAANWIEIFDFLKREVTLLDPAHNTFAILPASQLADRMAAALPQSEPAQTQAAQNTLASIRTNADSKVTGKTEEIQGSKPKSARLLSLWIFPCRRG